MCILYLLIKINFNVKQILSMAFFPLIGFSEFLLGPLGASVQCWKFISFYD